MDQHADIETGIFRVSYLATQKTDGKTQLGSATLRVDIILNGHDKTLNGFAQIQQASNASVNVISHLSGEWSYLTNISDYHALLVLDGFDLSNLHYGGQVMENRNVSLRLAITQDWLGGSASFNYLYEGEWYEVEFAEVETFAPEIQNELDELSSFTSFNKPKVN